MNNKLIIMFAALVVLGGIWFLRSGRSMLMPELNDTALKCSDAACGMEFMGKLPAQFDNFPVKCEKCGKKTAFIQTACADCGAHYALDLKHPPERCPKCNVELPH